MQPFHVLIRPRPATAIAGPTVTIAGIPCSTLNLPQGADELFTSSFETTCERLAALPRLFIEPDGSFVWASSLPGSVWQLDGNLYDRAERLCCVDLKGRAPPAAINDFLTCLGWPATPVLFEHVTAGVLLGEEEFRRLIA